jgi:adenylate cyclase
MQGNKERSIELLERAVEGGWGDRAWIETDSDLDSIRDDERFVALIQRMD